MMTNGGTFITNSVQRVVVNQMQKGVFFDPDKESPTVVNYCLIVE